MKPSLTEIREAIEKTGSRQEAADFLGVSKRTLRRYLSHYSGHNILSTAESDLKRSAKTAMAVNRELKRELEIERKKVQSLLLQRQAIDLFVPDENIIRFGVIGDTHYGSIYHYPEALDAYYNIAALEGIEDIFCCGDILDGHRIYHGQEFELSEVGFERQLDRFCKSVPKRNGITTHFITGNHDASFKHSAGLPVGKIIEAERPDWHYIGQDEGTVNFKTLKPFSIRLLHPGGGSAYALSYKPQKIVEQISGGSKPNILAIGHFHKAEMIPNYRNVFVLQCGTFQRQTPFMLRRGLAAHLGGWIVEVEIGEEYNRIKPEFVAFY